MKARILIGAAGVCLFAVVAGNAVAQPATGTRINGRPATGSMVWRDVFSSPIKSGGTKSGEAAQRVRKIAGCMANMHNKESLAHLTVSSVANADPKASANFRDKVSDCMSYNMADYGSLEMQMPEMLLDGLVAEAILHQWPRPELGPSTILRDGYNAPWMASDPSTQVVEAMAACLAERRPSEVVSLLSSEIGSAAQNDAIGAITPFMSECLQKGATLKTDAMGLRASIALGLFHRIVDQAPTQAAPAKVN